VSTIADVKILLTAWRSAPGGWRRAWRDAAAMMTHRQVLVETTDSATIVLRTRVRLNGDVQTEILQRWLEGTPRDAIEGLTRRHFQSVGEAMRGWPAIRAMVRLGTQLLATVGAFAGLGSAIATWLRMGWSELLAALLADWWTLSGIALMALAPVLRWAVRVWLRRKLRNGLFGVDRKAPGAGSPARP
jgi:hypothetical protein